MKCSPFSCLCGGTTTERTNNSAIEKQMKLAEKAGDQTISILMLGPGSSGKTTILKQITKIHDQNDVEELKQRRIIAPFIKDAVINYMKILCDQSVALNIKYDADTLVNEDNQHLREEILSLESPYDLTDDIVSKMEMLWADKGIRNTLQKRQHFQIHENVAYFLDRIDEISTPSYTPSFEDYIRFRQRSTGLTQTHMKVNVGKFGMYNFAFTDVGGQRSERRKWMPFVSEDINAVIFVVAISDYDLTMFEDNKTNRLDDSIALFKKIMVKGKFASSPNKSLLLFFNKYDLFLEKIKKTPITVAFKDFPTDEMNANNADDAVRFIAEKFLRVFMEAKVKLNAPLHIVRTTALDTNNIGKIFGNVTIDLVQENLRNLQLI